MAQVNINANVPGQGSVFAIDIVDPIPGATILKRGATRLIESVEADFINAGYFLSAGLHGTISTVLDENYVEPFSRSYIVLYKPFRKSIGNARISLIVWGCQLCLTGKHRVNTVVGDLCHWVGAGIDINSPYRPL